MFFALPSSDFSAGELIFQPSEILVAMLKNLLLRANLQYISQRYRTLRRCNCEETRINNKRFIRIVSDTVAADSLIEKYEKQLGEKLRVDYLAA